MSVRRLFAVGVWLCVTASATAVVWAGTSTVAASLTDRPAPVVAHRDVVIALESGAPGAGTTPGITTPDASSPPPTVASAATGAGRGAPQPPLAGPAGSRTLGPEVAPTVAPAAVPATPPTTQPPRPPTSQPPQRPTATYSTAGGDVTVACKGYVIDLVSATPNKGWAVDVVTAGPYYVEVHFLRGGQDEPLWAYCLGDPVRAYDGQPRQGRGPGSS